MAAGPDRPGIVAAVTGVMVEQGCNLADAEMMVIGGYFSMMIMVTPATDLDSATLATAVREGTAGMDLLVSVWPIGSAERFPRPPGTTYSLVIHGADQLGIVHTIASELATNSVTISDLESRLVLGETGSVYALMLSIEVPEGVDPASLSDRLATIAQQRGFSCQISAVEPEVL
jgi:glycine cleavage system transcriptional repressor